MQRLFVPEALFADAEIVPDSQQVHYLLDVLRLSQGDGLLLFNGQDGEWRAELVDAHKRFCSLRVVARSRCQPARGRLDYLFAPLKRDRLDYLVQKATEMGVSTLRPVLTERTMVARVNVERMRRNVVEAAEQCGILSVPHVDEPCKLSNCLSGWEPACRLVMCDENAPVADPIETLQGFSPGPLAVLVGPEGGFSDKEREFLCRQPFVTRLALGPRILRADTAAVAALTLVQTVLGDWKDDDLL